MEIKFIKHPPIELRIVFIMSVAAFINFNSPFYGSLFVLFFELSFVHITYSKYKNEITKTITSLSKNKSTPIFLFTLSATYSTLTMLSNHWGEAQSFYGLLRYISILAHMVFTITLAIYLTYSPKNSYFFIPVALSIILASLIILVDYNLNVDSIMNSESNRLIIASNIRYLGYIAMVGSIYCIVSLILCSTKYYKILFSFIFIINFSLLFWLGGRGAILAFSLAAFFTILINQESLIKKLKNISLTLGLISLSYVISIPFSVYSWNGVNRFFRLSQAQDVTLEKFSTGRFALWEESIELIKENPFWGYGPEAHIFLTKIGFLQPHNFILQFLLELGSLGTLMFIFILYKIIKMAINNSRLNNNINNLTCFGIICGIIIHGFYDGTLYHAPPVILFSIAIAYVLAEGFKLRNNFTKNQTNTVAIKEK